MSSGAASPGGTDADRLAAFQKATSLADLVGLTGAATEHAAYFAAKAEWRRLRDRVLPPATRRTGDIPGAAVTVGGHRFLVHGITHADTEAERTFLRQHVDRYVERGETVYCEQGLRSLYFDDMPEICEMDDHRWAVDRLNGPDSRAPDDAGEQPFDGLAEGLDSLTEPVQNAVFALVDAGGVLYGDRVRDRLGTLATTVLTTHEDAATGDGFEAFSRRRLAAADPTRLGALQRHYERTFLPQPLEREWLRRHDPELETLTHARNERMADYAVYHNDRVETVHLIVGAAHQPGVRYYLERHRDGTRSVEAFELVD